MKFTIEVEDFYMDDDDNLQTELKKYITREVVAQIWTRIETKIQKEITDVTHAMVEQSFIPKINEEVERIIKTGKIKNYDGSVSIEEYIKNLFEKNSGWMSPQDQITKLAKSFGDEMRNRFDMHFALQLVNKLKENNLLKEEAVQALLEKKNP